MLIIFILSNSWSFCCATVVAACRKYSKVLCLWMLPPCELEMAVLALRECETAPIVLGNKTNPSPWWAHRHNSMKVQSQIQQRRLILDQKKKKKEILHYECKTVQIDDESLMTIRAVSEFLTINLFFFLLFLRKPYASLRVGLSQTAWILLFQHSPTFTWLLCILNSCFGQLFPKFEVLSSKTNTLQSHLSLARSGAGWAVLHKAMETSKREGKKRHFLCFQSY